MCAKSDAGQHGDSFHRCNNPYSFSCAHNGPVADLRGMVSPGGVVRVVEIQNL
jgi:hypothetical protein